MSGKNWKNWVFNAPMVVGAIFSFIILSSLERLQETWYHEGTGHVFYEQPDRSELVPEEQYKRHGYAMGGMMLFFGVGFWCWIAYSINKQDEKRERQHKYELDNLKERIAELNSKL